MSYAEIHFHLLPCIDDGPASMQESVELARAALADGTRTIVATPHVHRVHVTDPSEIAGRVAELGERLAAEGIDIDVRAGGELQHDMVDRLSDRQLESIAQGPPGRRWLLLEAPFEGLDPGFAAAAQQLRGRGFGVVVAHPERAAPTPETQSVLTREVAAGSVMQLTAGSFAGWFGEATRRDAWRLLRSLPIVVISSDAHGPLRPPALRTALAALGTGGEPDAERLAGQGPLALLQAGLSARISRLVA